MQSFTSASQDREQCFNLRHQPLHDHDMSSPSIQRLRIGPTSLSVGLIHKFPQSLEYLDWDLGHEVIANEHVLRALFTTLPSLTHLSLRFRNRAAVLQSLKRCLKYAQNLEVLDLRSNMIGDDGIADLVDCILETNLKSLNLGFNRITDVGAESLARLVSDPACQLTNLDLNCNLIGNSGGLSLAKALKDNSTLQTFVLYGNARLSCGSDFVECLQFSNSSLSKWNLQRTQMECCQISRINYWLMLNKILKQDKLPSALWPSFLEHRASAEQDALFFFLSQKPDLMQRGQVCQ
jgi:Leucine-rich repeat (LRR) protein